jgi:hypothetical protein
VLIIDNITCLRYGTQNAPGAQNLMQYLQSIKLRYQVSIMVLAHTPKRNTTKPLSRNDLQGSKMLINFADSAFAIGESQQSPGLRYLKQIKQRSTAEEYGAANVCTATIAKPGNFLHFQFGSQGYETDHLTPYTEQYRKNTQTRIAQLNRQGQTIRQIATHLGLAPTTVFRVLKRLGECADVDECADAGGCADFGCADVQMKDAKMDKRVGVILSLSKDDERKGPEDAHATTNQAGPAAIPLSGGVQGCVMEDAKMHEHAAAPVSKSAPAVILSLSKDDVRKRPENAYVPTNTMQTDECAQPVILSLSKDDEREGPEDAHVSTNQAGPAVIPLSGGVQGCVMEDAKMHAGGCADKQMSENADKTQPFVILNDSEGSSPRAPADKSAPNIPLTHPAPQTYQSAPNSIASKSGPGVILSLSKGDVRKGPEDACVPTKQEYVMENTEHPAPEDAIPPHNVPILTPPPRYDTLMQVIDNNFGLYKQYQKEMAMLKADERTNERRRKKAEKEAEGT